MEDHSRVIIHVDLDSFYAQVEMNKNPSLRTVPLAIQQKHIVVTSNQSARQFGIKKCMQVAECLKLCPSLKLVNGEDLHDYRRISYEVTNFLKKYTSLVERLGLDENYLDVTELANSKLKEVESLSGTKFRVKGHVFGSSDYCDCGCREMLIIGSEIAEEIREAVKKEFNLTSRAGIAHNKLLAKLAGNKHKPNQQTTVFPNSACELLCSLDSLSQVPGIGRTVLSSLESIGVTSVEDLQNCPVKKLGGVLGMERAKHFLELSVGKDSNPVKASGKPLSIGLEDACHVAVESQITAKFDQLLTRLMILVGEDGRSPRSLKVTVRKYDSVSKTAHRESRQCNITGNFSASKTQLTPEMHSRLMKMIMGLFGKMIDMSKPFKVSLLGLCFTKFQEGHGNSIARFLKKNVEVQSVTDISRENSVSSSPQENFLSSFSQNNFASSSSQDNSISCPIFMDGSNLSNTPCGESPENEQVHLAKKIKLSPPELERGMSPSKLEVSGLHLSSEKSKPSTSDFRSFKGDNPVQCPPDVDESVFIELPLDIQKELWERHKHKTGKNKSKKGQSSILNFFVKSNV